MEEGGLIVMQLYCAFCGGELDGERMTIPAIMPDFRDTVFCWLKCQDCGTGIDSKNCEGIIEAMEHGLFN